MDNVLSLPFVQLLINAKQCRKQNDANIEIYTSFTIALGNESCHTACLILKPHMASGQRNKNFSLPSNSPFGIPRASGDLATSVNITICTGVYKDQSHKCPSRSSHPQHYIYTMIYSTGSNSPIALFPSIRVNTLLAIYNR